MSDAMRDALDEILRVTNLPITQDLRDALAAAYSAGYYDCEMAA